MSLIIANWLFNKNGECLINLKPIFEVRSPEIDIILSKKEPKLEEQSNFFLINKFMYNIGTFISPFTAPQNNN